MSIPFIAFGNDELEKMPDLGKEAVCPHCGRKHKVEYAKKVLSDGTKIGDRTLAYVRCGDEVYLVGVNGKDITSRLNFEGVAKKERGMGEITLRMVIQNLEEKITLVPNNNLARYAIHKLHQFEEQIKNKIKELQDMAGRNDYWEGSLDTYKEILGGE